MSLRLRVKPAMTMMVKPAMTMMVKPAIISYTGEVFSTQAKTLLVK